MLRIGSLFPVIGLPSTGGWAKINGNICYMYLYNEGHHDFRVISEPLAEKKR